MREKGDEENDMTGNLAKMKYEVAKGDAVRLFRVRLHQLALETAYGHLSRDHYESNRHRTHVQNAVDNRRRAMSELAGIAGAENGRDGERVCGGYRNPVGRIYARTQAGEVHNRAPRKGERAVHGKDRSSCRDKCIRHGQVARDAPASRDLGNRDISAI